MWKRIRFLKWSECKGNPNKHWNRENRCIGIGTYHYCCEDILMQKNVPKHSIWVGQSGIINIEMLIELLLIYQWASTNVGILTPATLSNNAGWLVSHKRLSKTFQFLWFVMLQLYLYVLNCMDKMLGTFFCFSTSSEQQCPVDYDWPYLAATESSCQK